MKTGLPKMSSSAAFCCLFDNCPANFSDLNKLVRHMTLMHLTYKNCQLFCHVAGCGKMYTTSQSYRKHVEREHGMECDKSCMQQLPTVDMEYAQNNSSDDDHVAQAEDVADEYSMVNLVNTFAKNVSMSALQTRPKEQFWLPKSTSRAIVDNVSTLFNGFLENAVVIVRKYMEEEGITVQHHGRLNALLQDNFH